MAEYVSKQAVESIFRNARKSMKPENYKGNEFFIRDSILLNAEQIVHLMQAADVAPVRHGKWGTEIHGIERSVCSECRAVYEGGPYNYCPKCGAKMDGEEAG